MTDLVADAQMPLLPNRRLAGGTVATIIVHGLLIASLFWLTPLKQLVVPTPKPVSVEIVTDAQFRAIDAPAPVQPRPPDRARPHRRRQTRRKPPRAHRRPRSSASTSRPSSMPAASSRSPVWSGSARRW